MITIARKKELHLNTIIISRVVSERLQAPPLLSCMSLAGILSPTLQQGRENLLEQLARVCYLYP